MDIGMDGSIWCPLPAAVSAFQLSVGIRLDRGLPEEPQAAPVQDLLRMRGPSSARGATRDPRRAHGPVRKSADDRALPRENGKRS
jgi:hypothetical protein